MTPSDGRERSAKRRKRAVKPDWRARHDAMKADRDRWREDADKQMHSTVAALNQIDKARATIDRQNTLIQAICDVLVRYAKKERAK